MWIVEHEQSRLAGNRAGNCLEIGQVATVATYRHEMNAPTDERRDAAMHRIVNIRHERDTFLVGEGHDQMRDPFFAAAHANHFALWVRRDAEARLHKGGRGIQELRGAPKRRIAVRTRIGVRLGDRVDDRGWRRLIRVTDAQIDENGAARTRRLLQLIQPREDVRRERSEAMRGRRRRCTRGRIVWGPHVEFRWPGRAAL